MHQRHHYHVQVTSPCRLSFIVHDNAQLRQPLLPPHVEGDDCEVPPVLETDLRNTSRACAKNCVHSLKNLSTSPGLPKLHDGIHTSSSRPGGT